MFLKLQLLTFNIGASILLIFFLCLGSQNLSNRYTLNFMINKTVPLPIGFIIGSSFTLGFLSGVLTSVLTTNNKDKENYNQE